jgi:hypothetical protein
VLQGYVLRWVVQLCSYSWLVLSVKSSNSTAMHNSTAFATWCAAAAATVADIAQDESGQPMVDQLFGVKLHTKLKCEETGEEFMVRSNMHASCAATVQFGSLLAVVSAAAGANWWLAGF